MTLQLARSWERVGDAARVTAHDVTATAAVAMPVSSIVRCEIRRGTARMPIDRSCLKLAMPDGEGDVFEIKHVFLRPETRGRGWGRLLLDELEARARALGAQALVLDTHHTLTAAGSLYASEGFTPIEPYNDNPNATRWYGMQLAP